MDYEHSQGILFECTTTQHMMRQPHVLMRPRIYQDGDMWCALYGDSIMEGIAAFGKTPRQAAEAWDLVWLNGTTKNAPALTPNGQALPQPVAGRGEK